MAHQDHDPFFPTTSSQIFERRMRTYSSSSLDMNEDPVSGLERISSNSNLTTLAQRRHMEEEEIRRSRQERYRRSEPKNAHATLSATFESLSYEIAENQLYRDEERQPKHQVTLLRKSFNRWVACFFIGIITACVAAGIDILVHLSRELKFGTVLKNLIAYCDHEVEPTDTGCMWRVEVAWMVYNCVLVGIAGILVIFIAPVAGGSGIPQVKCYLNGIKIPEVVKLKTLIAKAVGVSCAVAGGLSAGKEGPMIHSGAVVGSGVSEGRCKSLGIETPIFKDFRNDREKRDFVSAGAAAGVAAAFGAPIGGVLFALEEGSSFWNQNLTWRMFFCAMVSSFTLNSILSWYYKHGGVLSWTGLANFGVFDNKNYNIAEIPFFLMIGVIGGLSGALFNHLNAKLASFRKKYISNKWQQLMECIIVAAASALTGFVTLFILDDCQPVGVNPSNTEVNQLWCKKGEYSTVANLFFNTPEGSVKMLFHSPINSFSITTLLVFAVEYFILTLWTFGISVPAGVFIPALLTGAAWGRLVGIILGQLCPSVTGLDPGKYALAGAAAQLGGMVRMTISLTAIIMEATKDITFGLPIMLVLMITKWVGDLFNEGLYDMIIELQEVPVLGWHPPKMCRNILAENVMRSDVIAMERRERVSRIVDILSTTSHHGFPVVDRIEESMGQSNIPDYGRLKGIILRSQLLVLLKKKIFLSEDFSDRSRTLPTLSTADFDEELDEDVSSLNLTSRDLMRWMDLEDYMHLHPHRVPLNASLPFIFRLFRGLGLRYLMVTNDDNKLRGIITRKDVARFRERRKENQYMVEEAYISEDGSF